MKPGNRRCDARCQFLLVLSGTREMRDGVVYLFRLHPLPSGRGFFVTAKVAAGGGWGS